MLPDYLDLLDIEAKRTYMRLLTAVSAADGHIVDEEIAALEAQMGHARIDESERAALRAEWPNPPAVEDVLSQMDAGTLRVSIRDAIILAACDGEYDPAEVDVIERLVAEAGLDDATVAALYQWVTQLWKHMAAGRQLLGIMIPGDEQVLAQ